jgi:hypothetical protein
MTFIFNKRFMYLVLKIEKKRLPLYEKGGNLAKILSYYERY